MDTNGDGTFDQSEVNVFDGSQVALHFAGNTGGSLAASNLADRYLWGPVVDQLLADEQVSSLSSAGTVDWALTDQQNSIRDVAQYNASTGVTSVVGHTFFDSYGNAISQTGISVAFGYAGMWLDSVTGLYATQTRWYDPHTGRWMSEDPIGFAGGLENISDYVGNSPTNHTDPTGLAWWNLWIADLGESLGDRIGDGASRLFGGGDIDLRIAAARQRRMVDRLVDPGKDAISTAEAARERADILNRGLKDKFTDACKIADAAAASAELGITVGSIIVGGAEILGAVRPTSCPNPIRGLPRVGSALKSDPYHAFPNIVDNFATGATRTQLQSGASLYQIEGSLNGVAGRFEWIVDGGNVTHRMFVPGGGMTGVPIKP